MSNKKNPYVFLDLSVDGSPAERIVIELFADEAPKTAENFRALCTGQMVEGKTLHYKGTEFCRIHTGAFAQGGDLSKQIGTGEESIYRVLFADEGTEKRFIEYGVLCVHPCTPGFKFYIMLNQGRIDNGIKAVFGKVIEGMETVKKIDKLGTPGGKPSGQVKIIDRGDIPEEDKKKYVMECDKDKKKKKIRKRAKPSTYASEYYSSKRKHLSSFKPLITGSEFYSTLRDKVRAPLDIKKKNVMESHKGCLACRRHIAVLEFKGKKEENGKKAISSYESSDGKVTKKQSVSTVGDDERGSSDGRVTKNQLGLKRKPWSSDNEEFHARMMVQFAAELSYVEDKQDNVMESNEGKKEKTVSYDEKSDEEEYVSSNIPNHVLEFHYSRRKYWLSTSSNSVFVLYSSVFVDKKNNVMESDDGKKEKTWKRAKATNTDSGDSGEILEVKKDIMMESNEGEKTSNSESGFYSLQVSESGKILQVREFDKGKKIRTLKTAKSTNTDPEWEFDPRQKMIPSDCGSYLYPKSAYSYSTE